MTPLPYLRFERHDGIPVVLLDGEIDIAKAPDVRAELAGAVANEDFGLIVDLSEVTYLDSSGVTVLFELADRLHSRQQELAAVVPSDALIRRVLELVNLETVVPLHSDLTEAVAHLRALAPDDSEVPDPPLA
jgi:anti-anti-sigma factor